MEALTWVRVHGDKAFWGGALHHGGHHSGQPVGSGKEPAHHSSPLTHELQLPAPAWEGSQDGAQLDARG